MFRVTSVSGTGYLLHCCISSFTGLGFLHSFEMKGTIIWLDLKLGNSLSFSLSLAPEVTFSSTLLDVLHSLLELSAVSAHKSHGSRPEMIKYFSLVEIFRTNNKIENNSVWLESFQITEYYNIYQSSETFLFSLS